MKVTPYIYIFIIIVDRKRPLIYYVYKNSIIVVQNIYILRVYKEKLMAPYYEVVLNGFGPNGDVLTVLHYEVVSGPDPADWQELSDEFRVAIAQQLTALMPDTVGYTGITVREDIPGGVGADFQFTAGPVNGLSTDQDMVTSNALLVRKLTAGGVRPSKGRIYQGNLTADRVNGLGRWLALTVTEVETFWETMRVVVLPSGSDVQMVIKASKPLNPNTVPYNPVTQLQGVDNPVTQRRRRIGSGS